MWNKGWLKYLLLLAAILIASVLVTREFFVVTMMIAMMAGRTLYHRVRNAGKTWLLLPYGLLFAAVLMLLDYVGELLLFPHSPRGSSQIMDASRIGLISAFAGFFMAWGENYKGLPMLNDPPKKK